MGFWAFLGVGRTLSPQDLGQWDMLGLSHPGGSSEQRAGGAKSRTGWC